jgi:hypothetical protein
LKKQKLEAQPGNSAATLLEYSLLNIPQPYAASLHSPRTSSPASAEAICSLHTVQLLLDDFFMYIHPLVPVPHEPTFRAAFQRREDTIGGTFLALLASMIGFLVASFPRRPKLRLSTEAERYAFPNSITLVKRCYDVAIQARGIGYLDRNATVYDAAISYFLGICSGYVNNMRRCRVYLAECRTMIQVYDLCRSSTTLPSAPGINATGPMPPASVTTNDQPAQNLTDNTTVDLITQELGRRLFYVTLVGFQTLHQMGSSDIKTQILPETSTDRYPPLPLEIDDEFLFSTHASAQPTGRISQLVAFNANVRVYSSNNSLLAWDVAFGSGQIFDWEHQRSCLWECLQKTKSALLNVPIELSLFHPRQIYPASLSGLNKDGSIFDYPQDHIYQERRAIQYEIQKANVYASQLCTRSYLVENYWNLFEMFTEYGNSVKVSIPTPATPHVKYEPLSEVPAEPASTLDPNFSSQALARVHTDSISRMMAEERKLIIKEFFILLRTVNEVNLEPNCGSIVSPFQNPHSKRPNNTNPDNQNSPSCIHPSK